MLYDILSFGLRNYLCDSCCSKRPEGIEPEEMDMDMVNVIVSCCPKERGPLLY